MGLSAGATPWKVWKRRRWGATWLGLLGSIMLSKVRPRDFGSSNLGVRSLDQRACELVLYDLASWTRQLGRLPCQIEYQSSIRVVRKGLGPLVPHAPTGVPGHVLPARGVGPLLPQPMRPLQGACREAVWGSPDHSLRVHFSQPKG